MSTIARRVCIWLVLGLAVFSAATTTDSPLKDSIVKAQDTFLNAQGTIIRIHAGEVISGSLNELKSRLVILQAEIEKLIQSSNARGADSMSCISAMNNLTISYSAIETRLKGLQTEFEKHNVFESRTILFRDIIADIRAHRFELADEKFVKLGDIAAVQKVIHEVYAYSEENLGLILNFSRVVTDTNRCFAVLKSLHEEISTHGPTKALNLVLLAQTVEKGVLNCNSSDIAFRQELVKQIEIAAVDVLITHMKSGNFSSNHYVRLLLDALFDFCPEVFDVVINRLIDGVYGIIEPRVVLANIFLRCTTPQAISGISNLFWKTKHIGLFNNTDLIIDIASLLVEIRNRIDYADLSAEIKSSFDKIVTNIPICVKNLFFEESVCLWNKAQNVYLQAVGDKFNYDGERRQVLTTTASKITPHGAAWIPVKQGDNILFRNKDYPKEFLYYANFEYNKELRYVFSWIAGSNRDIQSAFKIELLNNESCYLKSTRFDEYLLASDVKFEKDDKYSYVFSWRAGSAGGLGSAFAWHIIAC